MGNIERGYNHPRAALEHAIRDPAIAQHEGWQQDARAAVDVIERLRQQHQGAVEALRPFVEKYDAVGREFCPNFDGPLDLAAFNAAARIIDGGQ